MGDQQVPSWATTAAITAAIITKLLLKFLLYDWLKRITSAVAASEKPGLLATLYHQGIHEIPWKRAFDNTTSVYNQFGRAAAVASAFVTTTYEVLYWWQLEQNKRDQEEAVRIAKVENDLMKVRLVILCSVVADIIQGIFEYNSYYRIGKMIGVLGILICGRATWKAQSVGGLNRVEGLVIFISLLLCTFLSNGLRLMIPCTDTIACVFIRL